MVLIRLSKEEFMLLGLQMMGFSIGTIKNNCYATNLERFKDQYYATPSTCEKLLVDIQSDENTANIKKPIPRYLLLTLFYLKKYPTKGQMAGFLDVTEKTALTHAKRYVDAIQGLKEKKIRWIFDDNDNLKERFIISVDGTFG